MMNRSGSLGVLHGCQRFHYHDLLLNPRKVTAASRDILRNIALIT